MHYQLSWPTIKAYEVGFLRVVGGIPCRPHPAATQLINVNLLIFVLMNLRLELMSHIVGTNQIVSVFD